MSLGTEFKFSSPDIPDIHEDQNFQFNFKAPVIKSEKVKEADADAGYVTDEKEFMTPEEMTESDEEEKVFVGSDVSALYPSFTARMKGAVVRKAILKTKMESMSAPSRRGASWARL